MKTKEVALVALFAALIVVLSLVPPFPVPVVPVPVTLQTLGVMIAGLMLGPRLGAYAVSLYVALALIGMPVLPGGRAGLAVLAGPTGGFLLGMIPGAALTGWLAGPVASGPGDAVGWQIARCWFAAVAGSLILVYAVGIPWMSQVTGMSLSKASWAMLVFVPGDLIKALLAAVIAHRVRRVITIS